jgi:DNA-binding beta-propeller fold protein YncE
MLKVGYPAMSEFILLNSSRLRAACLLLCALVIYQPPVAAAFTAFESGHVRPLALSASGDRLFAVNTPDNHLEIFDVTADGLTRQASVPVGLEPVAVAVRNTGEVWVVNHLSDSISIVNTAANPPRVTRTLLVGDEPRDIVFAGNGRNRAFITTAHRGQNSPYTDPGNPGELTTPGIGRADVWVFNATNPGSELGGKPLTIVTLFGDTPRPLAVSPDGNTVYAGIFHSGNRTTTIHEGAVCNGGVSAAPCNDADATSPGGLPAPNVDTSNNPQPEAGLIVRHNGSNWVDELGRNWDDLVRFNLPDKDVFAIDATANPPVETAAWSGVGTILSDIAVHPLTGKLFVANTEAINEVRFEGTRAPADPTSTVLGHLHETRITVIDTGTGTVTPRHLNKHIDYNVSPAPAGVADKSLALPRQLVISSNGNTLYLAAKGSDKVGIFSSSQIENDTFVPDSTDHITVSGGGPAGLLLDEARNRLYVSTRFDNGVSILDLGNKTETAHYLLHNPEPADLVAGRRFMYDARFTSSNGEAACASCHVDGDLDSLAWDLGDPTGNILNNPLDPSPSGGGQDFHPMKGPMATQTLRGMNTHGSMHWRGDRTGGNDEPNSAPNGNGGAYNEALSFSKFNVAFPGLLGRSTELTVTEMTQFTDFILQVMQPPNPVRNLDDSLTDSQSAGHDFYMFQISDFVATCNGCHVLDPASGFFGTSGQSSFEGEPQHMKVPQLRNMYSKVGMFGMPAVQFFNSGNNGHQGDQIRGFGFLHDGSTDTLLRFLNATLFNFPDGDAQRREVEQFMFAFDSNLKPVVGQQITLTHSNQAIVDPRVDLLIARAQAGDADLVVKGIVNGEARGWRRLSDGAFEADRTVEATLTEIQLRDLAKTAGQPLTFMAVPPGSGVRSGIDRDEDSVLDGDDNCPGAANPGQENNDADTQGDACDPDDDNDGVADIDDALPLDTDNDGVDNADDTDDDNDGILDEVDTYPLDTDNDGLDNAADSDDDNDGLADSVDPLPLIFNYIDGDVAPLGNPDGQTDAADYLVLMRVLQGHVPEDDELLSHGDLYPAGAPDGVLDLSDLILLQQLVLP